MKQIIVTFALLLGLAGFMQAQDKQQATADSRAKVQSTSVTVVSDTTDAAMDQLDSIIQAKVNKATQKKVDKEVRKWKQRYGEEGDFPFKILQETQIVGILAVIFIFGGPILLLIIILYFRYKSKKARYEVMKQALEHGKSLPSSFTDNEISTPVSEGSNDILWRKGIKTFFLGLGLALFLGILTDASLASIGLLIMCIGAGEILMAWFPSASQVKNTYNKHKQNEKLWEEMANTVHQETASQPKQPETKPYNPTDYAPKADHTAPLKGSEGNGTETARPQTKEEAAPETPHNAGEQVATKAPDERRDNVSNDSVDNEETKE